MGAVAYRVYSQWSGRDESVTETRTAADDRSQSQTHGFRLDWTGSRDAVIVEGGTTLE